MSQAAVPARLALAEVFREEAGRVTAALIRRFRDFDLAEECTQDALVAALESWPLDGVPEHPGGAPSPVVRLNRAIAVWRVEGPEAALRDLEVIAPELDGYHIFHAARGELCSRSS